MSDDENATQGHTARIGTPIHASNRVTDTKSSADERFNPACLAIVEPADTEPALCTIYSIAPGDSLVTTWISAHEGSYCTLENKR